MTKKEAVDQFIDRINYLHDSNYGDFKRKMDLAMTRMWEILGHHSKEIDNTLYELKKQTVFLTGMDVEEARNMALSTAEKIKTQLGS